MPFDYKALYAEEAEKADSMWAKPWGDHLRGDIWYNRNRNEICLEMLGDVCRGKRVLSVGARCWVESEFLESIDADSIVKTDIIPDKEDNVLEADAHNLPFLSQEFDAVMCRDLIEHVADDQKVFGEMYRVLKPNGYLLITTPNIYNFPIDGKIHIRGYTPESFLIDLQKNNFEPINKRGNAPNIIYCIAQIRKGYFRVLDDLEDIDRRIRSFKDSYYIGTQLFVLAQKG